MKQADWIIDIGPDGGKNGGEVVFTGTPMEMVQSARTLTEDSLRAGTCQRNEMRRGQGEGEWCAKG